MMPNTMSAGTLQLLINANAAGLKTALVSADKQTAAFAGSGSANMAKFQKAAAMGFAAVGTAAIASIASLVKLGKKFEEMEFTIRKATGASGAALDKLTDSAKRVYTQVEQSSGDVAKVVGDLNTRLGLQGEALENLAKQMIDLADIADEDVTSVVRTTTRLFGDWSIATDKQSWALDWLWKVSQNTGIGVGALAEKAVQAGAPLRELGFSFETATTMLGQFEKEGVNTETILASLKIGLVRLAKEGFTDAESALAELMRRIKEAPSGLSAVSMAVEIFGSRAATDFTLAVREGRFEFEDLLKVLRDSPETIAAADEATESLGDKWKTAVHKIEVAFAPLAEMVLEGLTETFDEVIAAVDRGDWGAVGAAISDAISVGVKAAAPIVVDSAIELGKGVIVGVWDAAREADFNLLLNDIRLRLEEAADANQVPIGELIDRLLYNRGKVIEYELRGYPDMTPLMGVRLKQMLGLPVTQRDVDMVVAAGDMTLDEAAAAVYESWRRAIAKASTPSAGSGGWARKESDAWGGILAAIGYGGDDAASAIGDLAGEVDRLAGMEEILAQRTDDLKKAYESLVKPAQTWQDVVNKGRDAYSEYVDTIKGKSEEQKEALVDAWEPGKKALQEYLAEMQKSLDAWNNLESNLITLVSRGLSVDAALKAAEHGADFVAALVGADSATQQKAFATLEGLLTANTEGLARTLTEKSILWSATGGSAAAMSYYQAWEEGRVPWKIEKNIDKYDGAKQGKADGSDYGGGFMAGLEGALAGISAKIQAAMGKGMPSTGYSYWGYKAGSDLGMSLEDYLMSQASGPAVNMTGGKPFAGMVPSTSNVWYATKSAFPSATFLGGKAYRPYTSDHTTGHAFDVDGSQMYAISRWLAANFDRLNLKYIIYNGQWNKGAAWMKYTPSQSVINFAGPTSAYHRDHVHVSTYDQGGILPPGLTLAANFTGQNEVIVPATLINAISDLIKTLEKSAVMDVFRPRAALWSSYVAREASRYSMYEAQGAPIELLEQTLARKIELIDEAVIEAQAQLDVAKSKGLAQEEINELAESLFDLRRQAADARTELQALARVPLENAAARWGSAVSQLGTMMDLVGNSSQGLSLQLQLLPQMLGSMGAQYQTAVDLMNASTAQADITGYATDAISSLSSMFSAEQSVVNRALSDRLSSIDTAERAWNDSWQRQSDALQDSLDRQRKTLNTGLSDLQKSQRAALDTLSTYYDERLRLLQDFNREITREEQRNRSTQAVGSLEDELRILRGQGYYTEADIKRMRDLETQIQEQRDAMQRQEEAWAREDEINRLQREREEQIKLLQQQQEAEVERLRTQIEAAEERMAAQQKAMQQEMESQRRFFEEQREAARRAAQAEIDNLVLKYQAMMQTVIDQQNALLANAGDYQNAGYQLGQSFAQGLIDALPLIQQAAQAAAQTAADYLQLRSPAKRGPLSDLDKWWGPFLPTLVRPMRLSDVERPSMDTASGARQSLSRHDEHIYLHATSEVAGAMDLDLLADKIERRLGRKVELQRWSMGS